MFVSPRSSRKRGRFQLRTVLGDVEFADDTVTCASASSAPLVEDLFDTTLRDWCQKRNVRKTERCWWFQMLSCSGRCVGGRMFGGSS